MKYDLRNDLTKDYNLKMVDMDIFAGIQISEPSKIVLNLLQGQCVQKL